MISPKEVLQCMKDELAWLSRGQPPDGASHTFCGQSFLIGVSSVRSDLNPGTPLPSALKARCSSKIPSTRSSGRVGSKPLIQGTCLSDSLTEVGALGNP